MNHDAFNMTDDLAASVLIRNKNNVWVEDSLVTQCHCCKAEFGYLFNRKHHCRNCGNIFCYTCTDQSIVIPDFIKDKPDPADFWNISYYITSLKGDKERVCKECYDIIRDKIQANVKLVNIFDNPVSIEKIKELSESNASIKNHYFDHLRNIQYYLPNHKYSEIDKKLLKINAPFFSQHSKYLVHLIKSMDWSAPTWNNTESMIRQQNRLGKTWAIEDSQSNLPRCGQGRSYLKSIYGVPKSNYVNEEQLQFIINIINNDKNKNCTELYCTRTCQEQLSFDDCINILYSCVNTLPQQIIQYLFEIISKTPEQVILCHLSFFITVIISNSNEIIHTLIFNLLTQTKKMMYHTYWFLNNAKDKSNISEITNINKFISLFDNELVKIMDHEYMFFVGLINHLHDPKKYLISVFDKCKPISLPYEPDVKLVAVDINSIETKPSYTKPVLIPFLLDTGEKIKLLFKKESITNDVTVLNLMTLCDIILCENLNTRFGVVVYPTMPLTANSGMIEIVDKAETIYAITSKKKPILQHIIERNEEKKIADVLDRYTLSLVSYTLHSYFLALGDRHLQNIMITDDAAIFHIDFGYILGSDAYPLTSFDIKLNGNMLDVLGGYEGMRYKKYLELCSNGVMLLRKYFNIFFILLSQDVKFKENHIEKFVMARFQPRQSDDVVITELMSVIKQSNNAFSGYIRDFLHYHTQEKTFQNGVGGIGAVLETAFDTVKNFAVGDSK